MIDMTNEQWVDVPEYEGFYQVSNFGNVRSVDRIIIDSRTKARILKKGKMLKKLPDQKGYFRVSLSKNGKARPRYIHQLVLFCFVGKQPPKSEVRHLDSNPTNNRLDNLVYGTKSENMRDAVKLGTLVFSRSKLTREDVIAIARDERKICVIAKEYGIHTATVCNIKTGKSFKGFTDGIFHRQFFAKPTQEQIDFILDRNHSRKECMEKTGFTLAQVKRIRKNNIRTV